MPVRELLRHAAFRNAYLFRGLGIWIGVRVVTAFAQVGDPNLVGEGLIVALVGALVGWDARRRNEDLFLANLGIPIHAIAVTGALGALALELLVP